MAESAASFVVPSMPPAPPSGAAPLRPPSRRGWRVAARLLLGWAVASAWAAPGPGEPRTFDLPAGEAASALREVARISGREILFSADSVRDLRTRPLRGAYVPLAAVRALLAGTGLAVVEDGPSGALAIGPALPREDTFAPESARDFLTAAAAPPRRHRSDLMRRLEPLLLQQAAALLGRLQPGPTPETAFLPPPAGRAPSGEHGIRPGAHTAKGLALVAALVPAEAYPPHLSPGLLRRRAADLVRGLVRSHGTDGGTCPDGRPWQSQWQSAYWAALAGEAAWLCWDELTESDRRLAARMIAAEADRFVDLPPPARLREDSKAEENAWNSQAPALAAAMFPHHPRRARWRGTAVRWSASAFARPADLERADPVDGRPLRDWLAGANLLDDFTLENHRRIHPDYMACTYLLTSQVPFHGWGGLPPPEALRLNVAGINAALQALALPDGSVVYPNGQDWGLRRHADWFEHHNALAVLYGDPRAAALRLAALATLERMAARTPGGSILLPTETKLSSDDAMALEMPAHAYALLAEFGDGPPPLPAADLMPGLAGQRLFPDGRLAVLRTARTFASFSWGAQAMGQIVPLGQDLLVSPEARSLVGHVAMPGGAREAPVVREVAVASLPAGIGVAGKLERGGGAVAQRFAFLALPDGRTVYADVLAATGAARPTLLDLGTIGVLNDPHWPGHRGERTLHFPGGTRTFLAAAASAEAPHETSAPWVNVDGRLGILRLAASGPARYVPAPTGAAGRLEQRFHLNVSAAPAAGPLAYAVLVFAPGESPAETARAAAATVLESAPGAARITLRLAGGPTCVLDLDTLRIEVAP